MKTLNKWLREPQAVRSAIANDGGAQTLACPLAGARVRRALRPAAGPLADVFRVFP